MDEWIDSQWLAGHIESPGSDSIATAVASLIASGRIGKGARLPTVRDFARGLGISASTVAAAWNTLRGKGLIETRRRGGTVVLGKGAEPPGISLPPRQWLDPVDVVWACVDLSRASADPALQPDLGPALNAGLQVDHLHAAEKEHMIDALRNAVAPTWPCPPQAWTTAGGGTEGMLLALQASTRPGDRIAIEEPTSPRLLGLLELLKVEAIPVACDRHGPLPAALQAALLHKPRAFLFQLRAQMPTGSALSLERRDTLALVLEQHPEVVILEDDHMGTVSTAPAYSLSEKLPDRTLLVRAYCRAFGVDLRTSVLGGAARLVQAIENYRSDRVAMTSRIFQGALAFLLTDPTAKATLEHARARYAHRRQALAQALGEHGFEIEEGTGLALWVPVADETAAIVSLASQGVVLGSGSHCFIGTGQQPYLRVAISRLPDDVSQIRLLADTIAKGVNRPRREAFD
ncbi:aminotransferase class I/II-fold pyridoxal phosphate-dependent enzyme [Pseudomonas typographi]|uniref:Aminotransferase class I/II-fold pyridoxal phosphate-dependent enzyme n=1 Tax=Pseudomonas typographi TaxID=2715964 RepID=A0ABR7Z1R1_9PSED|nr:aminotransferase class I/II-fold pyridoxal phosphate-dependent enzyme [Pseudomonas typographi]MBD1551479.1 aminotransferase class I/II-fold pyridoxal phosphate-dependent enzyme [Pseudomonas typographi]MBD1587535.1 aminotransferase class I/II-fold pyridoxal phosphate-dependent enzyme [Pseudomonas typographi]MBD1599382.1 aminotransferase class I/II-fold pyridoxal phosphate-dependent enzyme [Pseudomonas typographi]